MLRAQEDGSGGDPLQARARADQDQWLPYRAGGARDPSVQGLRANPPAWTSPFRWRRHADPREGRWPHVSDIRHPTEHREGSRRVLPEVRGRAEQEGD